MAELMLRTSVPEDLGWSIGSAGIRARQGLSVHPLAGEVLADDFGVDSSGFRTRTVTPALIDEADLILTATRTHRSQVVTLRPSALRRTFTLTQFANLLEASGPARAAHNGPELIDLAVRARSAIGPRGELDDIADPVDRPKAVFQKTGRIVAGAVGSISARLSVGLQPTRI